MEDEDKEEDACSNHQYVMVDEEDEDENDEDSDDDYIVVETLHARTVKGRAKRGALSATDELSMSTAVRDMVELEKNAHLLTTKVRRKSLKHSKTLAHGNDKVTRLLSSYHGRGKGKKRASNSLVSSVESDHEDVGEAGSVGKTIKKRQRRGRQQKSDQCEDENESSVREDFACIERSFTFQKVAACAAETVDLYQGPKEESVKKPSRNVGPKCVKETMTDALLNRIVAVCTQLEKEGWTLHRQPRSTYLHPFKGCSVDNSSSSLSNNTIARCIRNLMQRELFAPSTLHIDKSTPGCSYRTLEEILFFCVSFNSAAHPMFKMRATQSTRVQVTRIPMKQVERAQAAAIVMNEFLLSMIRSYHNMPPSHPYSEHAFCPSKALDRRIIPGGVLVRSTSLQCAGMPCKIKPYTLKDEAIRIARMQKYRQLSSVTNCNRTQLDDICTSVLEEDGAKHNEFWSCIALLYFCLSHSLLRDWLRLDAISIGVVQSLSRYACVEHTHRSNYVNRLLKDIHQKETALADMQSALQKCEQTIAQYKAQLNENASSVDDIKGVTIESLLTEETLRSQQLKFKATLLDNEIKNYKMARVKNGVSDKSEESEEQYNARASLGATPSDILQRWVEILEGSFVNVMCTISTNEDDAEMSTINNIQVQISRLHEEIDKIEENDDTDEQLTNMLWTMVRRIVAMMRSFMKATSLAPQIKNNRLILVDYNDEPIRTSIDEIAVPPQHLSASWTNTNISINAHTYDCAVLWSKSSAILPPYSSSRSQAIIDELKQNGGDHEKRYDSSNYKLQQEIPQVTMDEDGLGRTTLVFSTKTPHNPYMHAIAANFTKGDGEDHAPLGCVPFIAIGLRAQWIASKMNSSRRRPLPIRLQFGATLKDRPLTDPPMEREHAVPVPILSVAEFQAEYAGTQPEHGSEQITEKIDSMAVSYTVCANRATRIDDLYQSHDKPQVLLHAISLLSAAMGDIGYMTQIGGMKMPNEVISLLNNGARLQRRSDNTSMLNLTLYNMYVGGRSNMVRTMIGTPWEGCYPSWIDSGVTSFGIDARNYSDERNPGSFYISEETTKQYAEAFAENFIVPINDRECDQRPPPTRGIPYGLVPGIHSALNRYYNALGVMHTKLGLPKHQMCDMMVFPISPLAQQVGCSVVSPEWAPDPLPPHVHSIMKSRAWNPDNTDPTMAVAFSERMCTPNHLDRSDNLFENGLEELSSVITVASYLTILAEWLSRSIADESIRPSNVEGKIELIHVVIDAFLRDPNGTVWTELESIKRFEQLAVPHANAIAARALFAINVIYPYTHAIGDELVHPDIASTITRCISNNSMLHAVDVNACARVKEWWGTFDYHDKSKCAWETGLKPFLVQMLSFRGSHAMTPTHIAAFRNSFDELIKASFWVYSQNGRKLFARECPLYGLNNPNEIQKEHVDGIFVVKPSHSQDQFPKTACGGIVGVKSFQLQQLFTLLEASGKAAPEQVQIYRCGGQMLVRHSSDASEAPEAASNLRKSSESDKRYKCALFERDLDSQGKIEERREVCRRCRKAWDKNIQTFMPVFLEIERPQPIEKRLQADYKQSYARPSDATLDKYNSTITTLGKALQHSSIGLSHSHTPTMQ